MKILLLIAYAWAASYAQVRIPGPGGAGPAAPPGVIVTMVGSSNTAGTPGPNTPSITLSPSPTAGHTLVVSAAIYNCTAVTPTVTDNQGNTYTLATTLASNTILACTAWFTAPNVASSGAFTIQLNSSLNDFLSIHVYDVSTTVLTSVVDAIGTPAIVNSSSSAGTLNITTSSGHTVVFGNFSGVGTATTNTGGIWQLGYSDDASTNNLTHSDVYAIVTSASTYSPNVSWSVAQGSGYVAQAVAIKY